VFASTDTTTLSLLSRGIGGTAIVVWPTAASPSPAPLPDVPVYPENPVWILPNVYVVQPGDTVQSIASLYLRDAGRWQDIWNLNPALQAMRSPDSLVAGDRLTMPDEAVPAWISLPNNPPQGAPAQDPAPSTEWLHVDVDAFHAALFDGDTDTVSQTLTGIGLGPASAPDPPWPPALAEAVAYYTVSVEFALQGKIDPLYDPPETI
jgi:hypothetical protein